MYIIYESIANTDPRVANVQRHGNYGFYIVGYISPENVSLVDLDSFSAVEISETIALAAKFNRHDFRKHGNYMKFRVSDGGVPDLFPDNSLDDPNIPGADPETKRQKTLYELTDDNKANALEFLKILMRLELSNHYKALDTVTQSEYADKKAKISLEIDDCVNLDDAHRLMHNRMCTEVSNLQKVEENLGSPAWDLSQPGLEIRCGQPRYMGVPGVE
jgi:hypothetical protein